MTERDVSPPSARPKKPRWRRWGAALVLVGMLAFGAGALLRWPVCYPFDVLWNLGAVVEIDGCGCPDDGRVRVVFLQHGLWRTSASLGRLQRTLEHHGYEVVNPGYPSTEDVLEGHAKRLRDAVEARFAEGPVDEVSFVGHSMGGLVIQEYLRRDDAREPAACVYLATPHRGAVLAAKRRHWFPFGWVMGEQAAHQLSPSDAFHRQPIPMGARSGTIVGDLGEGNAAIPGPDDGTVGVDEATFAGAAASVRGPFGHTRIVVMDEVLRQVLWFLAKGDFAAMPKGG